MGAAKIFVSGQEVVLNDFLYGVRWWAQHYPMYTRPFDACCYFGSSPDSRVHFFRVKNSKAILTKTASEMFSPFFKPLLIDYQRVKNIVWKE